MARSRPCRLSACCGRVKTPARYPPPLRFFACTPPRLPLHTAHDAPSVVMVEPGRRAAHRNGVIAQMGERLNGIQEVDGSIPSGSTKQTNDLGENAPRRCGAFSFWGN